MKTTTDHATRPILSDIPYRLSINYLGRIKRQADAHAFNEARMQADDSTIRAWAAERLRRWAEKKRKRRWPEWAVETVAAVWMRSVEDVLADRATED